MRVCVCAGVEGGGGFILVFLCSFLSRQHFVWACLWAETLRLLLSTPVHLFLVSSLSAANTPACDQLIKPPTTET